MRVATHFAADCGEKAMVVFHRHAYLNGIEDYIWKLLRRNTWYMRRPSVARIDYDWLESVVVEDDDDEPLLGLADCVAHACHVAFNPDPRWGGGESHLPKSAGGLYLGRAVAGEKSADIRGAA